MITYSSEVTPPAAAIAALYAAAKLRRPVADVGRIRKMYEGSNVIVSAWDQSTLVGVLRGWTDGAYDGFVSDLAVHPDWEKHGIGRELLERSREGYPDVQWVLRASEIARGYYEHLGWKKIENGWFWPRPDWN